MARPYSTDLRDRVVASVASGRTCRATARLFGVSAASVVKWSQRFRATGSAAAYWMGGHRPRVLAGQRDWLLARLAEKPDLTLRAVVAELVGRGVPASYGAVVGVVSSHQANDPNTAFVARTEDLAGAERGGHQRDAAQQLNIGGLSAKGIQREHSFPLAGGQELEKTRRS